MPPRPGAPLCGFGSRTPGEPTSPSSAAARHQPRPMNGIVVAMMVMNWTFVSSGSSAM
jgi:hypothetical protein